jgi:hypothetical protein
MSAVPSASVIPNEAGIWSDERSRTTMKTTRHQLSFRAKPRNLVR